MERKHKVFSIVKIFVMFIVLLGLITILGKYVVEAAHNHGTSLGSMDYDSLSTRNSLLGRNLIISVSIRQKCAQMVCLHSAAAEDSTDRKFQILAIVDINDKDANPTLAQFVNDGQYGGSNFDIISNAAVAYVAYCASQDGSDNITDKSNTSNVQIPAAEQAFRLVGTRSTTSLDRNGKKPC